MKTKYKSKSPRTSGWQSQIDFDILLSDLSMSSLRFLKHRYNKEIREYPQYFDLNDADHQTFYKEMLQRKHMIDEEIENRNHSDTQINKEYFDIETGIVLDEHGNAKYGIAFNEDETGYVYQQLQGGSDEEITEYTRNDDYEYNDEGDVRVQPIREGKKVVGYKVKESTRSKSDIYKDWDYIEDLDD